MALELVRSFNKQGLRVILADSMLFPVGRWSNAISKYEQLPSARFETKKYINAITKLISENLISDLIPCCEETFYIAKYKNRWSCKVWTTDIQKMDLLHNKESFSKEFKDYLPIPLTISAEKFTDWSNSNKYVFKPKYSRFAGNIINGILITKEALKKSENWIAQKKVYGKEICVYSIWNEGKLREIICYEPLYRAGKGAGIFFRFIKNQEIESQVKRFGENINYTGQLSFDVMVGKNHQWYIECNPRGTSGAHLLNIKLAQCFFGSEIKTDVNKQDYMLGCLMVFTHPFMFLKKNIRQAKDVIFRFKDPLPAIMQWLSLLEIVYVKLSKKISLLQATTYDIEWNGDES